MARAYIGLGSNLGDRSAHLDFAVRQLRANPAIQSLHCSAYYETAPVGPVTQDDFLNAVAEMNTSLEPLDLLALGMEIERDAGRDRSVRWGPRTLDIDLLAFDQRNIQCERLTLPHPEARQRAFVLVPWAELAPNFLLSGRTIADWLAKVGEQGVRKFDCG